MPNNNFDRSHEGPAHSQDDHRGEDFPIEIIAEPDVTPELDLAVRKHLCRCFPHSADSYSQSRVWHESVPEFTVLLRDSERRIAGHVSVVERNIEIIGPPQQPHFAVVNTYKPLEETVVAGLQGVSIAPEHQGQHLSKKLLEAAVKEARNRSIPFSLLFCKPALEGFYNAHGWTKTKQTVTLLTPDGRPITLPHANIAMIRVLAETDFPEGSIYLRGPDW